MDRLAAAVVFAFALSGTGVGFAHAATADAASAPAVVESDAQYTVRPGQSLNDIAIALTQSHDRAALARASKAIFDANPNAFMGHDPSRMRQGAVLNVPSLDSLGVAASAPVAGSAAASASGAASAAAPAASAPAAPAVEASVPAAANASANTTASVTPNNASAVAGASAPAASSAAVAATSGASQPVEAAAPVSQPVAQTASGTPHVWTGSIQAGGASAATASAAATDAAPEAGSQARTSVSSLQQLLALKSRVLMELQKHGIVPVGKTPQVGSAAAVSSASTPQASAGVAPGSGATVGSTVVAGNAGTGAAGLSPGVMAGIAAAVAAVIALILSLTVRRRRRPAADAGSADAVAKTALPAAPLASDDVQAQAFPPVQPGTPESAPGGASLAAAAELGAGALPMEQIDPAAHEPEEDEGARYVGAGTQDQAVKAAETTHADLPPEPAEPLTPTTHTEPAQATAPEPLPQAGATDAYVAPDVHHDAPVQHTDHNLHADGQASAHALDEDAHAQSASVEPPPHATEFPREAVAALGALDMALPPRTESPAPFGEMTLDGFPPAASQPVVEPEVTARQAVAQPPAAPHAADEIGTGTAGPAAVAGLGAMPFGALKLDFDLELPPSPAQSLPAFTPEDLAKIARNKLELAAEYIELGDLSGARTLVNEVIESNDAATRNEARALLSTLAPLS
ncbi:FimV/HubP family polar landmark protein [Paraburkholderia sartisoli]|uniref:FimV C-terminal domain-containing protein n=1 Tax=Paraburkholderia sartisoli TaxID=83784 RepID=A0A1H4HEW0_9BURK|nr:FimV/HubP family polar landmark protein [Paraburkholderia sartisoli]SEB20363.1 FimV C-terminal domain-containing protein [Paraburkholderia sartisoli]